MSQVLPAYQTEEVRMHESTIVPCTLTLEWARAVFEQASSFKCSKILILQICSPYVFRNFLINSVAY